MKIFRQQLTSNPPDFTPVIQLFDEERNLITTLSASNKDIIASDRPTIQELLVSLAHQKIQSELIEPGMEYKLIGFF